MGADIFKDLMKMYALYKIDTNFTKYNSFVLRVS